LLIDKKIRSALRFLAGAWSCASTNSRRAACDSPTMCAWTRLPSVPLSVVQRRMRTIEILRALVLTIVGVDVVLAAGAQPDTDFDDLVKARSIHCEFFPRIRPADMPIGGDDDLRADVLVYYGGMNRERTRARVLSTRRAGSREVVVVRTDKAIHSVDHAAGLFMVTRVFGCNRRDKTGARRCLSYGAVNSRHFDASVHWQPDSVFERYRHLASHGFCDHGFVTSDSPGSAP
jgi:hypothetical protein